MPYVHLSEEHVKVARGILGQKENPRIGLVWSSSGWDPTRSIPFDLLRPLLQSREDLEFWCMQPHAPDWDKFCRKRGWPVRLAGKYPAIIFAACINEMDLVITTDSFAAHLAGALGRPAWVLLKQQPDWRWMLDREDSPWYPALRLLRQQSEGDWKPVVAAATRRLLTRSEESGSMDQSPAKIAQVSA